MNELAKALLMSGGVDKYNTFIGGISNLVTNKSQLASYLNISSSNVLKFKINDNNISAIINTSFTIPAYQNPITTKMTRFLYLGTNTIVWGSGSSSINEVNLTELIVPNALIDIGSAAFSGLINLTWPLGRIYTPKVTQIGSGLGNTGAFRQVQNNGKAIFSQNAETANNGNPDGDIQVLISKNWNVTYSQSNAKPQRLTNIQTTQVGGTYAELDFTLPTHVNDYLGYFIIANGFYIAFIENITDFYAVGLTPSSSNRVELRLVDEFFNISEPARFSVLTPALPALFQNAVAYFKLDETSGNAIDVVNENVGQVFGGVTQGVAGKIGTAYSFDGLTTTRVLIDVTNINFTSDFTIRIWSFIDDSVDNSALWSLNLPNDVGGWLMYGDTVFGSANRETRLFSQFTSSEIVFGGDIRNQWAHTTIVRSGLDVLLYVNGVLIDSSTHADTTGFANISEFVLANWRISGQRPLKGILDELIILEEAWTAGQVSDDYNNGNGTTI